MQVIILAGVMGYLIFSSLLLIALLQAAAHTSADWSASTLAETNANASQTHHHVVVGAVARVVSTDGRHPRAKRITSVRQS